MYLIHDGEDLFWVCNPENWDKRQKGEDVWIGSNNIRMADRSPLPRGEYRIILLDKAGERQEQPLYLSTKPIDPKDFTFPELTIRNGEFSLKSPYGIHTFRLYSGDEKLISVVESNSLRVDTEDLLPEADRRRSLAEVWVYVYDDTAGFSLLSGPFPVE